jgi:hypothetical protein
VAEAGRLFPVGDRRQEVGGQSGSSGREAYTGAYGRTHPVITGVGIAAPLPDFQAVEAD